MIYLKEFATAQDYETVKNNLPKPNVSLITDGSEVKYMKENPTPPVPEYVDLGLSVKWATKNLGATSITDCGKGYFWANTEPCNADDEGYCDHDTGDIYYDASTQSYTKYNLTDGKKILELSDDAVNVSYGGNWRIPSPEEFCELTENTNSAWTSDYQGSGVPCLILTSKINGNSIVFPNEWLSSEDPGFVMHTNELQTLEYMDTYRFYVNDSHIMCAESEQGWRTYDQLIRGVLDE